MNEHPEGRRSDPARRPAPVPRLSAVPDSVLRLKVTLRGVRPPVWRRLEVSTATSLGELHELLQVAMGWSDEHLHLFEAHGEQYGDPALLEDLRVRPESRVRLRQVAGPGDRLRYVYDFGDDWVHDVLVEAVLPPAPEARYPRCTAGRRACPPENCGGPAGYAALLASGADAGQPGTPDRFDRVTVDDLLAVTAGRRRRRHLG